MATSSGEDAPRDLAFLFSRNRLNVAISRARCLAYLVCSPTLLDAKAKTIEDMRLISTLCSLVEAAEQDSTERRDVDSHAVDAPLAPGLYETLITAALDDAIATLPIELSRPVGWTRRKPTPLSHATSGRSWLAPSARCRPQSGSNERSSSRTPSPTSAAQR